MSLKDNFKAPYCLAGEDVIEPYLDVSVHDKRLGRGVFDHPLGWKALIDTSGIGAVRAHAKPSRGRGPADTASSSTGLRRPPPSP